VAGSLVELPAAVGTQVPFGIQPLQQRSSDAPDEQPWDLRLIQRMSRGSDETRPDSRARPWLAAIHLPLVWVAALSDGTMVLLVIAIIATFIPGASFLWARRRAERASTGSSPSPFGR
jgi:hypothetical protein